MPFSASLVDEILHVKLRDWQTVKNGIYQVSFLEVSPNRISLEWSGQFERIFRERLVEPRDGTVRGMQEAVGLRHTYSSVKISVSAPSATSSSLRNSSMPRA